MAGDEGTPRTDVFLNYHGALLTYEDYEILKQPDEWFTDQHILFWEKYLIQEELAKHPTCRVLFIVPSISLLISNDEYPASEVPYLTEASHIFIPISDGSGAWKRTAGSHWSLLVVSASDHRAFHYDSGGSMLASRARRVCRVLSRWLGYEIEFHDLQDTPQQEDGSACGVFVCWAMKYLLVRRLLTVEKNRVVDVSLAEKDPDLVAVRSEMRGLVSNLRKFARRSTETTKEPPTIS